MNVVKILWRLVAVGNGSKNPLFDFFSAFAEGMFQCVDNLPFAAKHAKGMSLRYEAPIVADINHRTPTKHNAFGGLFI